MIISRFQKAKIEELKKRTIKLYRQGLTTRQVGEIVGKSHQWVAEVVKKLSASDKT